MAVIHTDKSHRSLAAPIAAGALALAGLGVWWYQQSSTSTSVAPMAPLASTSAPEMAAAPSDLAPSTQANSEASPQAIEKMMQAQEQTNQVIEAAPTFKPIKGPVTERPAFLSDMEWSIFKAVSMQQPDPDKALTALVNKVRFSKQLEMLQDLPVSADKAKRQALATELLMDLPERLKNRDYDHAGAVQLQNQLLADAEPDVSRRAAMSSRQSKLLKQIEAELAAIDAAAASAPKAP